MFRSYQLRCSVTSAHNSSKFSIVFHFFINTINTACLCFADHYLTSYICVYFIKHDISFVYVYFNETFWGFLPIFFLFLPLDFLINNRWNDSSCKIELLLVVNNRYRCRCRLGHRQHQTCPPNVFFIPLKLCTV